MDFLPFFPPHTFYLNKRISNKINLDGRFPVTLCPWAGVFAQAPLAPLGAAGLPAVQEKHHLTPERGGGGGGGAWRAVCAPGSVSPSLIPVLLLHPPAMIIEPKSGAVWGKCHFCKVKRGWHFFYFLFEALSYISRDAALRSQWHSRGGDYEDLCWRWGIRGPGEAQQTQNETDNVSALMSCAVARRSPWSLPQEEVRKLQQQLGGGGGGGCSRRPSELGRSRLRGTVRRPLRGHSRVILAEFCH